MHESVYSAVVNQNLPLYLNMPLQTLCQTMMTSTQLIRSRQSAHSNGSNPFSHHSNRALSRREPGSTFLSIHLNHILGALSTLSYFVFGTDRGIRVHSALMRYIQIHTNAEFSTVQPQRA